MKPLITYALRALSTFYPPQKPIIFSGVGSTEKLADLMIASGQRRPLLIADSFLLRNGFLGGLLNHLRANGCNVSTFDGVIPNPTFAVVEEGLKICLANECDSVFVVGGGSAIDAAKVIAGASADRRPLSKLVGVLKLKTPTLPFYAAPTTSGTGSEATNAAVISDTATHKKKFFVDPKYIPIATALDPAILKSLPAPMTAAVGMDALTHAIEAFTSRNNFSDTDRDAMLAVKLLVEHLPAAYANGEDLHAREMVALASFLAGYAFTKASLGYVHAISHQVSAHYDTPHGLANAIILPRILRFNKSTCASRFAELERAVARINCVGDDKALADRFIARVDALAEEIGIPVNLTDVQARDFRRIANDALAEARSSYAAPRAMRRRDVEAVLRSVSNGDRDVAFV